MHTKRQKSCPYPTNREWNVSISAPGYLRSVFRIAWRTWRTSGRWTCLWWRRAKPPDVSTSTQVKQSEIPVNVEQMLGQRRRRCPNINPTLAGCPYINPTLSGCPGACVNFHSHQAKQSYIPVNTTYWDNAGLMLGQHRRRWPNLNPTLAWCSCVLRYIQSMLG